MVGHGRTHTALLYQNQIKSRDVNWRSRQASEIAPFMASQWA